MPPQGRWELFMSLSNQHEQSDPSAQNPRTIFGIEVEWKLDIAGLVALATSLGSLIIFAATAAFVMFNYLQGPVVKINSPREIVVWAEKTEGGDAILMAGSQVTAINLAEAKYAAAIESEFVELKIGKFVYRLEDMKKVDFSDIPPPFPRDCETHSFGPQMLGSVNMAADGTKIIGCYQSDFRRLLIRDLGSVERVLPGGSTISHQTEFAAATTICPPDSANCKPEFRFLPWKLFLSALHVGEELNIHMGVRLIGGATCMKTCLVRITQNDLNLLMGSGWNWLECEAPGEMTSEACS